MSSRISILITSPSLKAQDNVSGISSLVNDIISNSKNNFIHFKLGSKDGETKNANWFLKQVYIYLKAIKAGLFYNFEIVHLNVGLEKNSIIRDFLICIIMKQIFKKKIVFHVHGGFYLMNEASNLIIKYCLKYLFKNADKTLVLSNFEKDILFKRFGHFNSLVLPNAINTKSIIKTADIKKEKVLNPLKLIYLGRINSSKGIFVICECFKYLKEHLDKIQFEIYGAGDDLDKMLNSLSNYTNLNYMYKGVISGVEKWKALNNSDIFLLPSIHSEGMPIAILEAMAAANTVIVTNDASITSVVVNNYNGIVVEKNNAKELASRIEDIILGKINNNLIGQNALNYIHENVSIDNYVIKLDTMYYKLSTASTKKWLES